MKTTDIAFTRKHLIFGTVTLVFILLVSCSKNSYYPSNTNSIEVTLESWNTDIDYLTIMDITRDSKDHLDILMIFEGGKPYTLWYGKEYSITKLNSDEQIPLKEEHMFFNQVKIYPDYTAYVFEGYAVKKFNFTYFEFRESGEYVIHNDFLIDPNEHIGTLDLMIHVVVPDEEK